MKSMSFYNINNIFLKKSCKVKKKGTATRRAIWRNGNNSFLKYDQIAAHPSLFCHVNPGSYISLSLHRLKESRFLVWIVKLRLISGLLCVNINICFRRTWVSQQFKRHHYWYLWLGGYLCKPLDVHYMALNYYIGWILALPLLLNPFKIFFYGILQKK